MSEVFIVMFTPAESCHEQIVGVFSSRMAATEEVRLQTDNFDEWVARSDWEWENIHGAEYKIRCFKVKSFGRNKGTGFWFEPWV